MFGSIEEQEGVVHPTQVLEILEQNHQLLEVRAERVFFHECSAAN